MRRRTLLAGRPPQRRGGPRLGAGTARAADPGPSVTKKGTTQLDAPGHLLRLLRRPGQQQLVPEERPVDLQGLPVRGLVHRRPATPSSPAASSAAAPGPPSRVPHPQGQRLAQRHLHGRLQDRRPSAPQHGLPQRRLHLRQVGRRADGQPRHRELDLGRLRRRPDVPGRPRPHLASSPTPSSSPPPRASSSSATASGSPATAATPLPSTTVRPGRRWGSGPAPPAPTPARTAPAPPATCTCTASTTT